VTSARPHNVEFLPFHIFITREVERLPLLTSDARVPDVGNLATCISSQMNGSDQTSLIRGFECRVTLLTSSISPISRVSISRCLSGLYSSASHEISTLVQLLADPTTVGDIEQDLMLMISSSCALLQRINSARLHLIQLVDGYLSEI
jgi:hypothetical protein